MKTKKDHVIWGNVETILTNKKWSLSDLARKMAISPQSLNSIKNSGIGVRSLNKLASALDVDEISLLQVSVPVIVSKPIPVISWVHAGSFVDAVDSWPVGVSGIADPVQSYVKTGPNAFGLIIDGDSMLPRFMPGDIAIIDPAIRYDNGSPCVVWINGEVSLKLFYDSENEIRLVPTNNKYPETIIKKGAAVDFKVIGKVVDIRARLL
jgi:SOS-response transcriptional repressor LexA